MKPKYSLKEVLFMGVVLLLPVIYLAFLYPSMPDTVPIHFDAEGKANGFSTKKTLWFISLLLTLLAAGLYLLVRNISSIDPKKAASTSPQTYQKISIGVASLLSAINIMIIYSAFYRGHNVARLFFPILGLFFVYLGNLMYSVKPNYFVGIRSPWTLENEDNWRATHRFGSKLFFAGGIFIMVGTLLAPVKVAMWILEGCIAVMTLAPLIYSFLYFKKHKV
ncbi:MAG: SdpI family protein [Chitinophagaceae bacterium]|nr:SdpI family protein [Chitinophagaceae bacterium]